MHTERRPTRRLVPLSLTGALALTALAAPPALADEVLADTVEIDIVGINDFHGRLSADGQVAGAAVLAGAVASFRAENPSTLFVSGGDNIGASTFTSFIADDVPTMDVLDMMGLDVSALGNHEFDRGRADLDDRVLPAVDFPYLAANIYETGTTTPAYDEYWVTDVDGVAVGFVGAITEDLESLVSPSGIATLDVGPMLPAVNRVADQLSDGDDANGEADVVVLLVHEGPTGTTEDVILGDSDFGDLLRGLSDEVDAVFSGHTHLAFAYQQSLDGWERPVVQSGQYSQGLAHVTLRYDVANDAVVGSSSEVVDLVDDAGTALFEADADVAARVAEAVAEADVLGAVPLGAVTTDLLRARQSDGTTENRGGESTLGNLVADIHLWATQDLGTQIAFMNPGGLRQDILAGDDGVVTYKEAAEVQPFANTLVTFGLTGAQVRQVLEEQWQPEGASRPFLRLGVAGMTYTYDPTAAPGERIGDVWVGGEPLDDAATYTVVANSFLASGGDNFFTLAEGTGHADSGRIDLQATVDYMAAASGPIAPDLAQRAVGVTVPAAPEGGFEPGSDVTVQLSSLLFSQAEGQGDTVVLSIDGTEVASAAIDPTVVDATDEQGRASVTFTVPEGVAGDVEVVVTVPGSGTETSFGIVVAEAQEPPPPPKNPVCHLLDVLGKKIPSFLFPLLGWLLKCPPGTGRP